MRQRRLGRERTALVELHDGYLELVHWSDAQRFLKPVQAVAA